MTTHSIFIFTLCCSILFATCTDSVEQVHIRAKRMMRRTLQTTATGLSRTNTLSQTSSAKLPANFFTPNTSELSSANSTKVGPDAAGKSIDHETYGATNGVVSNVAGKELTEAAKLPRKIGTKSRNVSNSAATEKDSITGDIKPRMRVGVNLKTGEVVSSRFTAINGKPSEAKERNTYDYDEMARPQD